MTTRIGRAAVAGALVAAALSGCTSAPPLTNTAVLTVEQSRGRYLDAMCPLRADGDFWRPVRGSDARAAAAALVAASAPAVARLADPPKPYPRLIRPAMTDLIGVLRGNLAYFEAARDASDAAAVAALDPPSSVPVGVIADVESRVTVSSAPGSGACTGHLPSSSPSSS